MEWSLYLEQQQLYALKYNNERHFQTNDSSLTKIIFLLVNIRKNKVSDLKSETSFTIYY